MTIHYIKPVIDATVRNLCFRAYPGHKKGCPNFGKRDICPPKAPQIGDYFDLSKRIMAVCIHWNIGQHIEKMKAKHPNWSERQCACCLYWQGTVRKQLRYEVKYNLSRIPLFDGGELISTDCPEAMGVDVTATMKSVGIILEWPPKRIVRKIALIGTAALNKKGGD